MNVSSIWEAIATFINSFLSSIFVFLPESPFKEFVTAFSDNEILQYLNWFIPVGEFISILLVWLSAIVIYYAYQIILRWIKAIAD